MIIETKTELLSFQQDAVNKLSKLTVGCLAMDMGTGKTRTVFELFKLRYNAGKINRLIYFCPISVMDTIKYEFSKHTNVTQSNILIIRPKTKKHLYNKLVMIVGLETLSGEKGSIYLELKRLIDDKTMLVVDESSLIRTPYSKRCQRLEALKERSKYRNIMNGTLISQGIEDLYSQYRFLDPRIIGYYSFNKFAHNHLEYHKDRHDFIIGRYNHDIITERIEPYTFIIKKEDCLDLPDKVYSEHFTELTDNQREYYEITKEVALMDMAQHDKNSNDYLEILFNLFTDLKSISIGRYRKPDKTIIDLECHRVKGLIDLINSADPQEKFVIWTYFRSVQDNLIIDLTKEFGSDKVGVIHGDIDQFKDRPNIQNHWKGEGRILLSMISSGNRGVDYSRATYNVFYGLDFNYEHIKQAEDRVHRMGLKHKCHIIRMISDSGIDRMILNSIQTKEGRAYDLDVNLKKLSKMSKTEIIKFIKDL